MKLNELVRKLMDMYEKHGGDMEVHLSTTVNKGMHDDIVEVAYNEGNELIAPCISLEGE